MGLYLLLVYIHIICAISWVGYALFWFFIIPPLKTEFDEKTGRSLIYQTAKAKWPPRPISAPMRLKITGLGIIFIAVLAATGFLMLFLRGFTLQEITTGRIFLDGLGLVGIGKVTLVAVMLYLEFFIKERYKIQARLVFFVALIIVGISVLLVR